jgi:hypothetical protein
MSRSTPDQILQTRSIRELLLDFQERRGSASTPTGAKKTLFEAASQLTNLINSTYPPVKEPPPPSSRAGGGHLVNVEEREP